MSSELKTRFVNHMILQRYSKHTIRNYVRVISDLAKFHNNFQIYYFNESDINILNSPNNLESKVDVGFYVVFYTFLEMLNKDKVK